VEPRTTSSGSNSTSWAATAKTYEDYQQYIDEIMQGHNFITVNSGSPGRQGITDVRAFGPPGLS
jgi:hypothetical protein